MHGSRIAQLEIMAVAVQPQRIGAGLRFGADGIGLRGAWVTVICA